jgi:RNA polymerase sigma-70 factor (ECF subfamily)
MGTQPDTNAVFSAWLAEHGGIVEKVSRAYAREERERADLARELMFQVWLSVPRFAGTAKAATWIYRVCLNTALTWRRNTGRREGRYDAGTAVEGLHAASPGPALAAEQNDLLGRMYEALHTLPEFDRSLLLLQLDGLAYRDIAEVIGLTENHVGVALKRARQRLAAQMKGVLNELE